MDYETDTREEKFVVRFPNGERDRIAEAARSSHRSMNSEIIARLMLTLENWPRELPSGREAIPADEAEARLLDHFRVLSEDQQTALLTLLKDLE